MVVSCDICGKQFDSFRGLNGHMNAHLPAHRKRAETFEAGDYNSFTDEFEALIKKYGQLLEYDTTFHSKERGGDDIMHISTSFRPNDPNFDEEFDAESDEKCDRNYHLRCNECRLCLDCNPAADAGGVVCRFCTGDSIERYDAENWTPCYHCDTKIAEGKIFYGSKGSRLEAFCDSECIYDAGYIESETFEAERGCNYSCPDCGTMMYQYNSSGSGFGSHCSCLKCGSNYITRPMNAENWGGDPKGQLAKALQKAREKVKPKPLNITKLPHPDQKYISDFEADEWKLLPRDPLGRWQKPVRSESINQLRESLQTSVPAISELLNLYGGDNPDNRYKLYNDLQSLKIDAMDAALPDDSTVSFDNTDMSWMTPQEYYEYILEEPIDVPDDTEDDSTTFEFQERLVRYTAMVMLPKEVETLIKENRDQITDDLFADNEEAESEINFLNAVRRYQKLSEQWSAEE